MSQRTKTMFQHWHLFLSHNHFTDTTPWEST